MTTRPEYTEHAAALRRVLSLPPKLGSDDRRTRRALEVALGVLDRGGTPEEARQASESSLGLHPYDRGTHLVTAGTASRV